MVEQPKKDTFQTNQYSAKKLLDNCVIMVEQQEKATFQTNQYSAKKVVDNWVIAPKLQKRHFSKQSLFKESNSVIMLEKTE